MFSWLQQSLGQVSGYTDVLVFLHELLKWLQLVDIVNSAQVFACPMKLKLFKDPLHKCMSIVNANELTSTRHASTMYNGRYKNLSFTKLKIDIII